MTINATFALVGGGFLPQGSRVTVDAVGIPSPRGTRPPVERVIEGEVYARQSERTGASAEEFARRLRMMADTEAGRWSQTDARNRASLDVYARISAVQEQRAAASRLDLYV